MDNFIVSARKYRPATFASVVGQSHITVTLKNAIARNQLAHAYLFCGPRGVGKTTCARIFAKAINCQNPVDSEACGECESCRSFGEGRSLNIHELDAASNNSVDDIRSLTDQVRVPPQVGRYSVYIIDEVHMLSQQAFNAFLKTLEEPPAHAIFILATTEKHKIIPTILSRCQIYDFNRIRVEDGVEYLKFIASHEGVTADDQSLNLIAQKADGGMRDALSMFDKAVSFCGKELNFKDVARTLNVLDYDVYFTVAGLLGDGDYKGALTLFDEVLRKGFSGLTFISGLSSHLRDLLMCKDQETLSLLEVTGSLLERYRRQSAELDIGFLFNAIGVLAGVDNTFKSATNQRLHVELGLMKLCGLSQKKNELTVQGAELPQLNKTSEQNTEPSRQNKASEYTEVSSQSRIPAAQVQRSKIAERRSSPDALPAGTGTAGDNLSVGEDAWIGTAADDGEPEIKTTVGAVPKTEVGTETGQGTKAANGTAATTNANINLPESDVLRHRAEMAVMPIVEPSQAVTAVRSGIKSVTGISINDILNGKSAKKSTTEGSAPTIGTEKVDPDAEQKIIRTREEFIKTLNMRRPRIATAFETMTVEGNRITIAVASEVLKEDIYSHQKEILGLLKKLSDTEGAIELAIGLKESPAAVRPIRPEDKLAHLKAKNPLIDEFRRELGLETE